MSLILTRRPGESIYLDVAGGIVITLVEHRHGEEARLAVQAPAAVRVDRWEIAVRRDPALLDVWLENGRRRYEGTGGYGRAAPPPRGG